MGSILQDIETTIYEGTYKTWFPEFLEILDKENVGSDYHLVYRQFTKEEFMSRPYNFPDVGAWEWLIKENIIEYDPYQEHEELVIKSDNEPIRSKIHLYCFTTKFFECYQQYALDNMKNDFSYWFYGQYQRSVYYDRLYDDQRKNYRYYFDKSNKIDSFSDMSWPLTYISKVNYN